ncbi:MAG: hypothetical protein ACE5KH_03625, partial [Candidatus Geothermarchaeales archaeon]
MDLFAVLLSLPLLFVVFFLPGFLTFKSFRLDEIKDLTFFERTVLQVLLSTIVTGFIALTLAILGYFSLLSLLLLLFAYMILMLWKSKFRLSLSIERKFRLNKEALFISLLLGASILLFSRPFEDVFGFGDAYVQVIIGSIIAEHGSIVFHDALLTSLPENLSELFLFRAGQQFNGLIISNLSTGEVRPDYLHLNATWMAVLHSAFGTKGALYLTPIFGVLSVLSIYLSTKHLFNWKIGAIASGLLTFSYLQIWFARSHSAEILLQFLIFGGILMFILFEKFKSKPLAFASATMLGLTMATSVEAGLIIIPLAFYFTFLRITGRLDRHHYYFIASFVASLAFILVYYSRVAAPYVMRALFAPDRVSDPESLRVFEGLLLVAVLGSLMVINALPPRFLSRMRAVITNHSLWLRHAVVASIVAFLGYSLLTLLTAARGQFGSNLVMLSWYLTPLVMILGILGVVAMIYLERQTSVIVLLGITLVFFYFIVSIRHGWGGPWWMRRYIFADIPLFFIGTAYSLHVMRTRLARRWRTLVPVVLLVLLGASTGATSYPILNFVQYEGAIQQIDGIFGSLDDDSILVFADSSYPHTAYPLHHISGKEASLLRQDLFGVVAEPRSPEDVEMLLEAFGTWKSQGKQV